MKFREQLVMDFIVLFHEKAIDVCCVPRGQASSSEMQMSDLEVKHSMDWSKKEQKTSLSCVSN
jgi:hypothetical protein